MYREAMLPLDGTPSGAAMVPLKMEQIKHTIDDHRDAIAEFEEEEEASRKEQEAIDLMESEEEDNKELDLPEGQRGERQASIMSNAIAEPDTVSQGASALAEEAAIDRHF